MIPLKWKLEPISKQDLANPLLEQTVTCPINPTKLSGSVTAEKSTNTVLANPLLEQTVTCPIIPTKLSDSVNAKKSTNRVLNRNRRLPITRSDNFLW